MNESHMNRVSIQAQLSAQVRKDGKFFVSSCPPLDVFSQGKTIQQALENLTEAVSAFLVSCLERKVLDDVLLDCGFRIGGTTVPIGEKSKYSINVPMELVANAENNTRQLEGSC